MARLLIVYGTTDGHTRRIAEAVAQDVANLGHTAFAVNASTHPRLEADAQDAVIVCAPIRTGRHPAAVARFVRENLGRLNHLPTAFFSVSLTAAGKDVSPARACVDAFLAQTGWRPGMVRLVAGALLYTRYNWFVRWMMRRIARQNGGDTDVSRDYVYTDWQRLRDDVEAFLQLLPIAGDADGATMARAGADGRLSMVYAPAGSPPAGYRRRPRVAPVLRHAYRGAARLADAR